MQDLSNMLKELKKFSKEIKFVSEIKPGKEADVYHLSDGSNNYALKKYKPDIKFSSRKDYFKTEEILESRVGRAIKNNTSFGKKAVVSCWMYREYDALRRLYRAGVHLPEVYTYGEDYLLLELITDIDGNPAPQLYNYRLTDEEAELALFQVATGISMMWDNGYVHGDLSAYNILWDGVQIVIIDLPQVIMVHNEEAPGKLLRDIDNVEKYFMKYRIGGIEAELEKLRELAWGWWG